MLGPLIVGLATGEATSMVRRARPAVVAYLAAAVLACIGLVFLLLAAWIFLARRLGPIEAALWFGGVFVVLAAATLIVHRLVAGARARTAARQRTRDLAAVAATTTVAAIPAMARSRGGLGALAVGVAALGGFALYRLLRANGDRDDADR